MHIASLSRTQARMINVIGLQATIVRNKRSLLDVRSGFDLRLSNSRN